MTNRYEGKHGQSVAVNSIFNVIHTAVKLLFPLFTSMYAARVLSVEGIGKFTTANNLVSYFVVFSSLGIPVYGIREIARLKGRSAEKDRLFTELLLINAIATGICTAAYLLMLWNLRAFADDWAMYLCCGSLLLFNFINIDWLYKGNEAYSYITLRSVLVKVLSFAAIILFVRDRDDYVLYALITCLGHGANYIFNIVQARKYVSLTFRDLHPMRHMPSVCYLFGGTLFATLYSKTDITMLGLMAGDRSAAYYSYAHRIVEMATMVCTAISEVFLPRLSFYYQNDRQKFRMMLDTGVKILIFLSVPMVVGLVLLAPNAITLLYGELFLPSASVMQLMAPLILIKSVGDLVCYQLAICTGNEKKRVPVYALAAAANIILNGILIPNWTEKGAVAASVISELIVNVGVFLSIRKTVSVSVDKKALLQAVMASIIMGCAVYGVCLLPLPLFWGTVIAVGSGVIVYFGINLMMRNSVIGLLLGRLPGRMGRK